MKDKVTKEDIRILHKYFGPALYAGLFYAGVILYLFLSATGFFAWKRFLMLLLEEKEVLSL